MQNYTLNDEKLRRWQKLVGETGDLADIVVATMSLAKVEHKVEKIPVVDFFRIFDQLQKEFAHLIPPLYTTHTGDFMYSRKLASALENALRIGVHVYSPQLLTVEETIGKGNLERIRKRAGEAFIEKLKPVAKRMSELVAKKG